MFRRLEVRHYKILKRVDARLKPFNILVGPIEKTLEACLHRNGWTPETCCVIVLDPELEIRVWSPSTHVAEALNISNKQLHEVYQVFNFSRERKPSQPKEAMLYALKLGRRPFSASIFGKLAQKVSLDVKERAFDRLRYALQRWFPEN